MSGVSQSICKCFELFLSSLFHWSRSDTVSTHCFLLSNIQDVLLKFHFIPGIINNKIILKHFQQDFLKLCLWAFNDSFYIFDIFLLQRCTEQYGHLWENLKRGWWWIEGGQTWLTMTVACSNKNMTSFDGRIQKDPGYFGRFWKILKQFYS